jgi:hypothetical protein
MKWRKWCKLVSHFLFNSTYGLPVLTIVTSYPNHVFYYWLVELQAICANRVCKSFSPNNNIRICLLDMRHSWITNAFWGVNNKKWRKWWKFVSPLLFNNSYGLPMFTIDTKSPNQVLYYRLVLNRAWTRDSLQIIIIIYVYSSWTIVEFKTRFDSWISRNDLNGLSFFNLSMLITLMA